jgi:hypothetical protein
MTIDLTPIVTPILAVVGSVLAGVLAIYIPIGIAAFQKRTGIQLTAQQQATMLGAVQTGAGIIETKLDQGVLNVAHVEVTNPAIVAQAQAAIAAVPIAAASLGMTEAGVARMIVGKVDTLAHAAPMVALTAPTLVSNKS